MRNLYAKISSLARSPLPWFKLLVIIVLRSFLKLFLVLGDIFDFIFFNGYIKIRNDKPVFLIGHPRSGTTFLHRFLLLNNLQYRGMYLWEMIIPSITYRKLLKSFIPYLDKISKKKLYNPEIHKTGLLEAETDDVALFFNSFEGLFFWLYFRAFSNFENTAELEKDLIYHTKIEQSLIYLKKLHKKNLFEDKRSNKIMFSKSFSLIININLLLENFPSARIILLLRDPLEVIPSSMSLIKGLLQKLFNFDSLNENTKQLFYKNLYGASLFFYKELHETLQQNGINSKSLMVLNYKDIKHDFTGSMYRLIEFLELERSEELSSRIVDQENKQKSFKSGHIYSLEEFGLIESKIREDFKFIYDNYDI